MKASKEYLEEKGYLQRISFQKTPIVKVKLISDEKRVIKDSSGEEVEGVAYKVLQGGEEKEIFTASLSLIQQLVDLEENDFVQISMKRKKTNDGVRTFFEVEKIEESNNKDIPVIEEDSKEDVEEINAEDMPF